MDYRQVVQPSQQLLSVTVVFTSEKRFCSLFNSSPTAANYYCIYPAS